MTDDRITLNVPVDHPTAPAADDDNELGWRRERTKIRARMAELELVVATRLAYLVPTSTSTPLATQEKHGLRCGMHPHVRVSMRTPRVECAVCGTLLDPLDVLREYAKHERNFAHTLEHLRAEKAELTAEVDRLRRQRSSLRSQVKKRTKKAPVDEGAE